MSSWRKYVTNFYNEKKKTNPSYKFKNALVDASKDYKKGGKTMSKKSSNVSSKKRSNKNTSRKNKK